jgi:hypothetical protein
LARPAIIAELARSVVPAVRSAPSAKTGHSTTRPPVFLRRYSPLITEPSPSPPRRRNEMNEKRGPRSTIERSSGIRNAPICGITYRCPAPYQRPLRCPTKPGGPSVATVSISSTANTRSPRRVSAT